MGLLAALISTVFVTSKDTLSKKLASRVDGTVSAFASFLFAIPFYLVLLAVLSLLGIESFEVKSGFFTFILLRGLSDTCAEWLKMHALAEGDLSLITSFLALYPIILLFISPLITGDPLSPMMVYSTLLTVLGTLILVFRPAGAGQRLPLRGIVLAVGAAIFFSINTSLDRMAAQTGSPVLSGFLMTVIAGVCLWQPMVRKVGWSQQLGGNAALFWGRGFCELAFMVSKLYALTVLSAPYVVAIQRISVLLSIISGRVLLKEGDFLRRFLAGLCIVSGVALVVFWG
ncbi:MAG: DMT family transporter [Proteobacteria bacterium]|nr:DMT family transporter [Pseudomonadota bacterium]